MGHTRKRQMFGELENKTLASVNMEKPSEITIVFNDNGDCEWESTLKRVWGRKEVERHIFRIREGGELRWLECGKDLGKEIREGVKFLVPISKDGESKFDTVKELRLGIIQRGDGQTSLTIPIEIIEHRVPRSFAQRALDRVRDFFLGD